jgi:hypothetical protein
MDAETKTLFNLQTQIMSYVNQTTGLSYNFDTSESDSSSKTVERTPKFPAAELITSASAATVSLTLIHHITVVDQTVSADMTINVLAASERKRGDILILKLANDAVAPYAVSFGTYLVDKGTLIGTASNTAVVLFIYDGTNFVEVSRSPVLEPAVVTSSSGGTVALAIYHPVTIVEQAVGENMTINLTAANKKIGDRLIIKLNNDGTIRTVTFGTLFKASGTVTGTASKTIVVQFVYDGTQFIEVSRTAAIDLA